jgi:hypothetical protein
LASKRIGGIWAEEFICFVKHCSCYNKVGKNRFGGIMLEITKNIVLDENQKPFAVQIPIKVFEKIEEILENQGLAKLINEIEDEPDLSVKEAREYYKKLK